MLDVGFKAVVTTRHFRNSQRARTIAAVFSPKVAQIAVQQRRHRRRVTDVNLCYISTCSGIDNRLVVALPPFDAVVASRVTSGSPKRRFHKRF